MLPQNPQGITNSDRLLLEAVNAQTHNLNAQTKVLHTVSDKILQQNAEFRKLRKDIQDIGKTFLQGNNSNFAGIKKYFEKANKDKPQARMNTKSNDKSNDDKGFFKGIVNKLFGPSKYQQRMMDDTATLIDLTESMTHDINFIKKQYEEPARARERELLAEAIAKRINNVNSESGGSGLLSVLAGALLTGLGALLMGLGRDLISWLSKAWETLKDILKSIGGSRFPGNVPPTGEAPNKSERSGNRVPTPVEEPIPNNIPKETQRRLPQGKLPPLLPGPAQAEMENNPERLVRNSKGVYVPESQMPKGMNIRGGLAALLGLGAAAYAAYSFFADIETKENISQAVENQFPESPLAEALRPSSEEYNKNLKMNSLKAAKETRDAIKQRQKAEKDRSTFAETDPRRLDIVKETEDETSMMNKALKSTIDALFGFEQSLEEAAVKTLDAIAPWIDKQTSIDFGNNQKLDLFPNLGTSMAEVLKEVGAETKELVSDAYEGARDITTNIVNNMQKEAAANPIAFTPSAASTEAAALSSMNLFKRGMGRIR